MRNLVLVQQLRQILTRPRQVTFQSLQRCGPPPNAAQSQPGTHSHSHSCSYSSRRYSSGSGRTRPLMANANVETATQAASTQMVDTKPDDTGATNSLQLTPELIHHLERTSLVDFDNIDGLRRLEQAVEFANQILEVDTTGIEPMSTVLEEIVLHLREDKAVKTSREDILANAAITEDDYFVSPPGNIPLEADVSSSKFRKY